jgi:RES domain-containing protein
MARPWSGDVYRFAIPRWATRAQLLSGDGALRAGGRWHFAGAFRAVYASLSPETALAESLAHYRRFDIAIRTAMPRTISAIVVSLRRIGDLNDGLVRRKLGVSYAHMLQEEWWSRQSLGKEALTQCIGRSAFEAGLEGLLVPSAAMVGGRGLVWFPDNLHAESTLHIVNPDDLPEFTV